MKNVRYITIHCAATRPSLDIGADEIRSWHVDGNGWSDIGYHFVIRRDGTLEMGRPIERMGAHVGGHNTGNIGVCMVGGVKQSDGETPEDNFTAQQWAGLRALMVSLHAKHPNALIMGHNGFPEHESRGCPCFDWRAWRRDFLESLQENEPQFSGHWIKEIDYEEVTG